MRPEGPYSRWRERRPRVSDGEDERMQPSMWTSYLMDQTPEEMVQTFAAHGWRHLEMSDEHAKVLLGGRPPRQEKPRLADSTA